MLPLFVESAHPFIAFMYVYRTVDPMLSQIIAFTLCLHA